MLNHKSLRIYSSRLLLCLSTIFSIAWSISWSESAFAVVDSQNMILNDAAHGPLAKTQALETLKKARELQKDQLIKLDQEIKAKIAETQPMQIASGSLAQERAFENKFQTYTENLRALSLKRSELVLKQKFIDQLMFQIDSKWNGQAMRAFLEHSLLDMSLSEMTDTATNLNQAIFDSYSSIAIREIPEPTEDLINFTIAYMNFASISKPRSPAQFINVRNYSNGVKSVTAKISKTEGINKLVERRLKVIDELKSSDKNESNEKSDEQNEEYEQSKAARPKPSGMIINLSPNKVSEMIWKN
jgi:hypothetical protein